MKIKWYAPAILKMTGVYCVWRRYSSRNGGYERYDLPFYASDSFRFFSNGTKYMWIVWWYHRTWSLLSKKTPSLPSHVLLIVHVILKALSSYHLSVLIMWADYFYPDGKDCKRYIIQWMLRVILDFSRCRSPADFKFGLRVGIGSPRYYTCTGIDVLSAEH